MSKSKENDNGRYFEYLISKELEEKFKLVLTERAKADQERDREKQIGRKTYDQMIIATKKIIDWLQLELSLDEHSILDRLPDKNAFGFSHEDISIQDSSNRKINFSLKHNHSAVFHGRIVACKDWTGIDPLSPLVQRYENEKKEIISNVQTLIPVGTKFADKGIYEKYRETWSNFIFELHESTKKFLVSACDSPKRTQNLFKTILGSGGDQYRVLKKQGGSKVVVQDIRSLTKPNSVEIRNIQKISAKDKRSKYVWHLVFEFDNGIKINARNKHDSRIMRKTPQLKSDWQVIDWGESGMVETILP